MHEMNSSRVRACAKNYMLRLSVSLRKSIIIYIKNKYQTVNENMYN